MYLSYDPSMNTIAIKYDINGRTNFECVKNALQALPAGLNEQDVINLAGEICTVSQQDILRIEAGEQIGYDFSTRVALTRDRAVQTITNWNDKLFDNVIGGDVLSFGGSSFTVIDKSEDCLLIIRCIDQQDIIKVTKKAFVTISNYTVPYVELKRV